ncbi:PepSY domain-containing protein [Thalassolituus sp. LLYu03]|uniref:PepSY domain-containing protein n=1 Tax=Thalassolituus sp. LLYu03 TaxID=3421656 RepID=UPI003D2CBE33
MKRLAHWIQWHRRFGLLVAPVVLMLVITGILINHSQGLGWSTAPVYSKVLGALYSIPDEPVQRAFPMGTEAGDHWLLQSGEHLYLDAQPVQHCEQLLSAAAWTLGMAALCDDALLLLTPDGELIERITDFPPAAQLGAAAGRLTLVGRDGEWLLDDDSLEWQPLEVDADWAEEQTLPDDLRARINAVLPLPGLTLERVLLDVHSGRLFGDWGVWLVDAAAILMLFLAFSGSLTWLARKLKRRRR